MHEKPPIFSQATAKSFSIDEKRNGYYWVEGESSNPPLLLLTGFTGTHKDVLELARQLKKHYFVIIPELPGWGMSPRTDHELTIAYYAQYLFELTSSLHLLNLTICGHCMGATLAIECGILFPKAIKSLVLVSTPYIDGTLFHAFFKHLSHVSKQVPESVRPVFFLWRSRIITIPLSFYVLRFKSFRKKLRTITNTLFQQPIQDESVIEENWNSMISYDYTKLNRLTMPVHLIFGGEDKMVPYIQGSRLHAFLPRATMDIIPHAGHLPPVETPDSLATIILHYQTTE